MQRRINCDFGAAFQNAKVLTNIYAELPCPLEEKPKRILEIDKQLLDHTFQETYYINTNRITGKTYYYKMRGFKKIGGKKHERKMGSEYSVHRV